MNRTPKASIAELQSAEKAIFVLVNKNPLFTIDLMRLLFKAYRCRVEYGWLCKEIIDESKDKYDYYYENPVRVNQLHDLQRSVRALSSRYHSEYHILTELLREHRMCGYTNLCRMVLGESAQEVKGLTS